MEVSAANASRISVSYTHLDVYKRQVVQLGLAMIPRGRSLASAAFTSGTTKGTLSVSYTHLTRESLTNNFTRVNLGTTINPIKDLAINFDYTFALLNDYQMCIRDSHEPSAFWLVKSFSSK